jgi:hypothetical protein
MENSIQRVDSSPMAMASEFLKKDSNVDVDKLAKLLDVQERWEANEAKKAYVEAMAAFKSDPPKIAKDQHVKYNAVEYDHASLQNVTSTINEALSRHGLTASWVTNQDKDKITVSCQITHIMGHSESTSLSASPDSSGSKNPIQAIGSTVTYLQRYTLLSLTGLATEEQDDDGRASVPEPEPEQIDLTDAQNNFIEELRSRITQIDKTLNINIDRLTAYVVALYRRKKQLVPESEDVLGELAKYIAGNEKLLEKLQEAK